MEEPLHTQRNKRQAMKLLDDMDVKVTTTTFINSLIVEANADVSVYFGG